MTGFGSGLSRRRHHRVLVPISVTGAGLALASAAFACAPIVSPPDAGPAPTLFQSCTAPAGARYPCKPMLNTPKFPAATSIKGAAGSSLFAYVPRGLIRGVTYDLRFANKVQQANGTPCHFDPSSVIGGPAVAGVNGAIPPTAGTIPPDAPLGAGQVCFSDVAHKLGGRDPGDVTNQNDWSEPAVFKVIV